MTVQRAFLSVILCTALAGCSDTAGGGSGCFDGQTGTCLCPGGDEGRRMCQATGFGGEASWSACDCTAAANNGANNVNNGPNNANNGPNNENNGPNNENNGPNNENNGPNNENNGNNGANNANNGANNGVDPDAEPPVIDAIEASPTTLTPDEVATVTAQVSDPQGAHTIFGGSLRDTDANASVGSFALTSPGVWEAQVGWAELSAAEPIEFSSGGEQVRHLQAVFQDLSGNEVGAELELTLQCENDLDAATGAACAPPRGPNVTTFTVSPTEIEPGDGVSFFARVDPDPDNPGSRFQAVLQFNSSDVVGPLTEATPVTFTGNYTWEQLNAARPFDTSDLDRGDRRSIRVTVTDDRGLRTSASANLTARCADPLELPVGGVCVGECSANHDLCARFGPYSAKCLPDADRCWWLSDASTPARGTTCNSLCERIDLRCDGDIGFPDGYSGVRERCYGSPGCYGGDQRRLCATPTRSGENSRLACTCVR